MMNVIIDNIAIDKMSSGYNRGDKTLRTESWIIVPDEIMIIIVCKFSVDHKRILFSR